MEEQSFLLELPVGKLMKKYAIPCIISLLVAALYNIVDQIFIANASYLGSYGNAANTVVFPLPVVALVILLKPDFGAESRMDRYTPRQLLVRCGLIALVIGCYDGFFGPGTGTFLMIALSTLCGFDLLTASGNTKLINLSSNLAAFVTFAVGGKILWQIGLPAAVFGMLGNYVGSGLALKNGAKVIRPMFIVVLVLLLGRLIWELFL